MGCYHDRGTSNDCTSNSYNYGYRDPDASFRTILAYSCASGQCDNNKGGGCTRIPRFSNPNYTWGGKALGSATANNARQINDVLKEIAGYKTHVIDGTNGYCNDTSLRFKTRFPGGDIITRTCSWVAAKSTSHRCGLSDVSSMCPFTCGTCDPCVDGTARMRFTYNDNKVTRSCSWVGNKDTTNRCALDGMKDACRETCGSC